ncbi:hypothetical protein DRO59_03745 [Candidatus Bathyarchaeota archaeon]|nr:MAG: hypothetical protein DRO59_03745 [Candidatus Bathyarchaeota archaeon]
MKSLAKIKKWFGSRKTKSKKRYEEEKREFEMAMGKPFIIIKIEIPKGFEDQRAQFLSLEKDEDFLEEIRDLIKKRLTYEKRGVKPT